MPAVYTYYTVRIRIIQYVYVLYSTYTCAIQYVYVSYSTYTYYTVRIRTIQYVYVLYSTYAYYSVRILTCYTVRILTCYTVRIRAIHLAQSMQCERCLASEDADGQPLVRSETSKIWDHREREKTSVPQHVCIRSQWPSMFTHSQWPRVFTYGVGCLHVYKQPVV